MRKTFKIEVFLKNKKTLNLGVILIEEMDIFAPYFDSNPPKSILNPPVSVADTADSFWKVSLLLAEPHTPDTSVRFWKVSLKPSLAF